MQALQRALVALRTARACRVQPTPTASVRHYASGNGGGGVGPAAAGVQDEKETAAELGKKEGQGDTGAAASGNTSSPNGGAGAGQPGPDENEQQRQVRTRGCARVPLNPLPSHLLFKEDASEPSYKYGVCCCFPLSMLIATSNTCGTRRIAQHFHCAVCCLARERCVCCAVVINAKTA